MASISFEKYKLISDQIGLARASMLSAIDNMFSAVYEIAVLDDVQSTLDLLQPMFAAYQFSDQSLRSLSGFTSAIASINNHVIRRNSAYADLDAFLDANNADVAGNQLSADFCSKSNDLGYTISAQYIND